MVMKCLGSGSSGNCYLLENDKECLIIECGIPFIEIQRALKFDISKIVGCLASHEHKDHMGYANEIIDYGFMIYTNFENAAKFRTQEHWLIKGLNEKETVMIGNFKVCPFYLPHNETANFGYLIEHEEMGRLLFLTDFEFCKYKFKNINHIMIEANYSKEILAENLADMPNKDHIISGHCDIDTACRFITENKTVNLENIILLHLSEKNSSNEDFIRKVNEIEICHTEIAHKGIEINFGIVPF